MKADISRLMAERQLDAIIVSGNTDTSSDLAYLTGGARLEGVLYIQRRNAEPVMFVSDIEREQALAARVPVRLWSEYDLGQYPRDARGDLMLASLRQWTDILNDLEVSGRVGLYGQGASGRVRVGDNGSAFLFFSALAAANPQIQIDGELYPNLFAHARETKDGAELAAMKRTGLLTCEVIDSVKAFVGKHQAQTETWSRMTARH